MKLKAACVLTLTLSVWTSTGLKAQDIRTVVDKNGLPVFQIKLFGPDDGYYGYSAPGSPASSIRNLSETDKSNLTAALRYWGGLIEVTPGQNPAVINVGTDDSFGGSAFSALTSPDLAGAVTNVQAAINDIQPGTLEFGAHGQINIGQVDWAKGGYQPSPLALSPKLSITTVMIHEVAHALGIGSHVDGADGPGDKPYLFFGDVLAAWESHLYDDNNRQARPGQLIYCALCENSPVNAEGEPLSPDDIFDVRNDRAHFSGDHVREVLAGAMPGVPLTLYSPIGAAYNPDGGFDWPVFSHLELKNSLMSHQQYRNYVNLMEAEVAVLQDLGYQIDRRNFWGFSVYGDNQNVVNDHPFFARNQQGSAYLSNTYNTSTLGLGLHVYGSHNTVTQRADLLSIGAGGGGIRIDGEGNHLTILPGTRVYADGSYARGVMFAYGKDHRFVHRGDVQAMGEHGIAASFDFGHNAYSDAKETRGSYIRTSNGAKAALLTELNGPLVKTADITGRLAGKYASIFMSENAYVGQINVMGPAQLSGDIISKYDQVDGQGQQRITRLTFGHAADAQGRSTGRADPRFAFSFGGNIDGINNLALELAGGVTQLNGKHALYRAEVAPGAMDGVRA
jgi:subtilase-type serine protease